MIIVESNIGGFCGVTGFDQHYFHDMRPGLIVDGPANNQYSLSIILRVVGGGNHLQRCLERLMPQIIDQRIEVIVPYDLTVFGIDELKSAFPLVSFIDIGLISDFRVEELEHNRGLVHELYDYRTAAGLRVARGEIVALIEDFGLPASDWCQQIIDAHKLLLHPVIGGSVENIADRLLNWAVYFLDFGRYASPLVEGSVKYLTDVNLSYKRHHLEKYRKLWENSYNEVVVNWEFQRRGEVLWLRPQMVVYQDRGILHLSELIAERFYWGRIFGCKRVHRLNLLMRTGYILASPLIPFIIIGRLKVKMFRSRRNFMKFLYAMPAIILLAFYWSVGELAGYFQGERL